MRFDVFAQAYKASFGEAGQRLPDDWRESLSLMFYSKRDEPTIMPQRPPCGWAAFIKGLPWWMFDGATCHLANVNKKG